MEIQEQGSLQRGLYFTEPVEIKQCNGVVRNIYWNKDGGRSGLNTNAAGGLS